MSIPEHKVDEARAAGLDVDEINEQLAAAERQAEDEQREAKEVEAKDAEAEVVEDEVVEEVTDAAPEITEPELAPQVTAEDVATAAGAAISAALEPIAQSLAALNGRLETMEGAVKELGQKQQEQEAELTLTPAASLAQMIKSNVIGHDETRVDGRSSLAKDEPKEAEPPQDSGVGIPFIDSMLAGKDWRGSMDN